MKTTTINDSTEIEATAYEGGEKYRVEFYTSDGITYVCINNTKEISFASVIGFINNRN